MDKLIVVIMGPGKKHFAEMCLDSVKDADTVLYWSSNPKNIQSLKGVEVFNNHWNENDKATNAKARNLYLDYLKEHYPDDWTLILDEDEILSEDGIKVIKNFISAPSPITCLNVHMRHFIGNIGCEDATLPIHFVPHRLFKISDVKEYPLHSHPILTPNNTSNTGKFMNCTIWHMGHLAVEYMDYILKRYKQHSNDSIIHTQQFLKQWKMSHLLGNYPIKRINPLELPKQICDRYELDKDEFYFNNRGLEVKHFIMTKQWNEYFKNKNVLDIGCGRGPFLYAWTMYNVDGFGFDKSKFAVTNSLSPNANMWVADILDDPMKKQFDLVTVLDILEHLKYEDLDKALKNIYEMSNNDVLFSIPFVGDPNLELDSTHIIKEDKEWWINKLNIHGFKIKSASKDWLFNEQLLIGKKK